MCLDKIKDRYKIKDNKCGYGYKVVRKRGNDIISQYKGNRHILKEGKWLHERNYREDENKHLYMSSWYSRNDKSACYPCGWHILLTIKKMILRDLVDRFGAGHNESFGVIRVKYRHAHTRGRDMTYYTFNTIVAKEIFIISDKRGR